MKEPGMRAEEEYRGFAVAGGDKRCIYRPHCGVSGKVDGIFVIQDVCLVGDLTPGTPCKVSMNKLLLKVPIQCQLI
jgi:hypothetical protein